MNYTLLISYGLLEIGLAELLWGALSGNTFMWTGAGIGLAFATAAIHRETEPRPEDPHR